MGNVLIIDDTKNIRNLLTTCLKIRGYEVVTAQSGQEALVVLEDLHREVELIFLDIRMPGMSGTEVLKAFKEMQVTCPIIIMTAFPTVKNAIDCTKLGAVAYLQKPFTIDRVNTVVNEILEKEKLVVDEVNQELSEKEQLKQSRKLLEDIRLLLLENKFEEAKELLK